MRIDPLYHWSPSDRRENILRDGLQVYVDGTTSGPELTWPYLCFGTTPQAAWRYSGGMGYEHFEEIEAWDLYQVALADSDEVHVRPDFGPRVKEVRVHNAIPADRVWWVARREDLVARCQHGGTRPSECEECFPV